VDYQFEGVKIYAIGKISQNGWRNRLFPIVDWLDNCQEPGETPWPDEMKIRDLPGAVYVGPHFLSDDHGCYHGANAHGVSAGGAACGDAYPGLSRPEVAQRCLAAIGRATHIFGWIDEPSAYGSLVELGYARALGKQTHVYMCDERPDLADLWFAGQVAHGHVWVKDADVAWADFKLRLSATRVMTDRHRPVRVRLPQP